MYFPTVLPKIEQEFVASKKVRDTYIALTAEQQHNFIQVHQLHYKLFFEYLGTYFSVSPRFIESVEGFTNHVKHEGCNVFRTQQEYKEYLILEATEQQVFAIY